MSLLNVVTGPPCSGKTTHVHDHRSPESVVIDLDALASALGYPADHLAWRDRHPAAEVARGVRYQLVRQVLANEIAAEVWLIDSAPSDAMRHAYDRAGATLTALDPGEAVCLERARDRGPETVEHVRRWYAERRAVRPSDTALDLFG